MNCNKFIRGFAMLCASSFLWVSCQKDDLNIPGTSTENSSNLKLSGVVPDDPALVAKVPLITSADFMADTIANYFSYQPLPESARSGGGGGGRDRTTPSVTIVTPTTGSIVSNTVNVQVSASDNVAVSSVVLKVDGTVIATGNIAPYNFSWNTAGLSAGTHTLTATATDAAGNSKTSTIQVGYNTPATADITPPSVSITSPTNGASVESTITVGVAASDNIGVNSVSFKVDGVVVGSDNIAPYNFSWNTTTVGAGVHSLTATAMDGAGNNSSNSIQVTVNTTVIPPTTPLPASVQLVMPPVGHQGSEGSCMAWAASYVRSAEIYYTSDATSYNVASNIFSPEYIYNQTKISSDCNSGTAATIALSLLVNKGVSSWQTMPYSSNNGCSLQPTASQDAEAANFKINSYSKIYNNDPNAIKTMLASRHPILTGITVDANFFNAKPGYIWNQFSGYSGDHAVVLCGYDDAKRAFKAINSWGTEWGDAGYIWIDYDFFPTISSFYLYVVN